MNKYQIAGNPPRRAAQLKAHSQQGLGLVSAIFVITVLALMAAGMAAIVANSAKTHSHEILSIRAQSAAQSGIEIQLAKIASSSSCQGAQTKYNFNTQGLYECSATLSCSSVAIQDQHFISLKSVGSCGSGQDRAVRFVEKRVLQ